MKNIIEVEVFNKLFSSIAEEMGIILRRSSFSSNIKERCDFSCAIFDRPGELAAQAAHIPVHLGTMPKTLEFVLKKLILDPGDIIIAEQVVALAARLLALVALQNAAPLRERGDQAGLPDALILFARDQHPRIAWMHREADHFSADFG